jgi:shikimate dehydrogenase
VHIKALRDQGYTGLNVTVPFKLEAYKLADKLTPYAEKAQAVNTLYFTDGEIIGHNSDGLGMIAAILSNQFTIADQHILVIGAGGAVRGVLQPLIEQKPSQITIVNRTKETAESLAHDFTNSNCKITAKSYAELELELGDIPYQGLVQGTSLGLDGKAPPLPSQIAENADWAYDMCYASNAAPFLHWCSSNGLESTADGWSMLVSQAAESYLFWTDKSPNTHHLIKHPLG